MKSWMAVLWSVLAGLAVAEDWQPVTEERLLRAGDDPDHWLSHGRSWREQRFSPLADIDEDNVHRLGLAWHFDVATQHGMESTPLVADGRMYVTASWSVVYALDAATGELLWEYDPEVPRETSIRYCCGAINRGVALWQDKVYVGTLDGRLVALEARSGEPVWQVQTTDPEKNYSITGAPRIAGGQVLIGNGGAEYDVRGYVTAYDAETGAQRWRFHTVPGNPAEGFESEAMARAAETWTGEWWKLGGGGTVWDAIAYDPELGLVYIGVGNGAPHNHRLRSPDGGDNLYLTSIVALDARTGDYVWHLQQVPGESWDYTATQQMALVDIEWQGEPRRVIMHAPKAGFFYLIDRETGELLSAEPFATVTWASHYDLETGRPVERPGQRYKEDKALVFPTGLGAHNWNPMSYSPLTGLMYLPVLDFGGEFKGTPAEEFQPLERHWNVGYDIQGPRGPELFIQALMQHLPQGSLLAWDPLAQREVWRVRHARPTNGGTLATAGNLVFQGTSDNGFHAWRADTGEPLWSWPVQNGVQAGPVSYRANGEQYIAVTAGRGRALSMVLGLELPDGSTPVNRVLAFRLDGEAELPPVPARVLPEPLPRMAVSRAELERGQQLYDLFCSRCHGIHAVSDGSIPDLRHLPVAWHEHFEAVVLEGLMERAGMPRFDDVLDRDEVRLIQAFVLERANQDAERRAAPAWWTTTRQWFYRKVVGALDWMMRRSIEASTPATAAE